MKSHILFSLVLALLLTACASHEGRNISSTDNETQEDQAQQAFYLERNNARETGAVK